MMMGVVKGAISIKNQVSSVLKTIKKDQSDFRKDVVKTQADMKRTWDKKYHAKVETSASVKKMNDLKRKLEPFRKKVVTIVAIKDTVTSKLKTVSSKLKAVGKMTVAPLIKIKDAASAGIKKIGSSLKKIAKSVVIPVAVAGTVATAGIGGAVSSGMQLEQQQVSMKHFIGATNKDMDSGTVDKTTNKYIQDLRNNANATPFETGDVISAGSRAIAIANGNTKEAMTLVKQSEDMAAASGGTKSISDAIEALADAKVGETERLKEFGFKVSAEDMKKKGFSGVASELGDFYGGASEKLASTGAGLMSTITGKLKSNFADFGLKIVEKLKPAFEGVIGLVDKASPIMEKFGGEIAENIGKGIKTVTAILPKLISGVSTLKPVFDTVINGFKPMMPMLSSFGSSTMATMQKVTSAVMPVVSSIIQTVQATLPSILPVLQTVIGAVGNIIAAASPIISGLVAGIGTVVQTLAPVFNTIFGGIAEKVGSVIGFVSERMGFITEVINWAAPMISSILSTAWNVISPVIDIAVSVFKILFSVVQKVFPGIQKIVTNVWNFLKPIVEGIGTVVGGIAKGFGWIADKLSGDNGNANGKKVGTNADGTNNWRGGATWVGEKGAELIDLPRGTRILPHKESVRFADNAASQGYGVPKPITRAQAATEKIKQTVHVTITKLADSIIVREDADIDKISDDLATKVTEALKNLVPV